MDLFFDWRWWFLDSEFDRNLIASLSTIKNFLITKIKSDGDEVTDFYDKEIPKVHSNHTCLAVISLDSALKKDENYYSQVFLK